MATPYEIVGPVNLGSPDKHIVLELAQLIIKLTGSKSKIVFKELPQNDFHKRCPDLTLAIKIIDWNPTTSLEAGLIKVVNYFKRSRQ